MFDPPQQQKLHIKTLYRKGISNLHSDDFGIVSFVFNQASRGPFSWLVLNQLNLAYFRVLTLEMSKFFKTKSRRMRNCFRLFHIYEYNCKWRMKKWEKVKIWQNVFENWKCHLENFWRVSDMDIQIYLWQLWSSCITNPIGP